MHSQKGLRHPVGSFPERARAAFWVAEDDGVVAWCFAHRRWHRATDNGYVWLGVLAAARGRRVEASGPRSGSWPRGGKRPSGPGTG
jgi:hypothetical protein